MSDCILEIHIIYCDKDKKCLPALLEQCKNFKIKNSIHNWKIFIYTHDNCGKNNIGQFRRRIEIIKNVPENHFIWFVDGDDEVINDVDLMKGDINDLDIFVFNYMSNLFNKELKKNVGITNKIFNQNIIVNTKKHKIINIDNIKISIPNLAGPALWNKWIRKSCWTSLESYLKSLGYGDIKPVSMEDTFLSYFAVKNSRKLCYIKQAIYYYHNEFSSIYNDEKYIYFDNFKTFRTNHKEIVDATVKLQMANTKGFLTNDLKINIQKALSCFNIKDALNEIIKDYSKEDIIKTIVLEDFYLRHPYVKYLAIKYLTN